MAMKRYILLALLLFATLAAHAELPQIENLGKQASKQKSVDHSSVGNIMLGVAARVGDKKQRSTFKMLDNIEIIECKNRSYTPTLIARTKRIVESVGAEFIGSKDDGKAVNELYGITKGGVITELIIIVKNHNGHSSVVAMSGKIPHSRLNEIEKIKR